MPSPQIEGLIAAHVRREHIQDVSELYQRRWWDYRRMSPGHSFYFFAHCYYKGAQLAARKVVNERPYDTLSKDGKKSHSLHGASLTTMNVADVWSRQRAHISGLWKAMLVCDAFCIPYNEYVKLVCRVAFQRHWKHVPRPAQLYNEELGARAIDQWDDLKKARLFLASHPIYADENYIGLSLQDEYREWAIQGIKDLGSPVNGLMDAIYVRRQIPESLAVQHFPQRLVDRARLLAI